MTGEDAIRQAVEKVLASPELARRLEIAKDREALADYRRRISAPTERKTSAVDANDAPVHYETTVTPLHTEFFTDPVPGSSEGPAAPASGNTVRTRICLEDGSVAVVNVVVQ